VKSDSARRRFADLLSPTVLAWVGTMVVAFLLILPLYTLAPGDHELASCGTPLALDLDEWRYVPDGGSGYYDGAHRHCSTQRLDRVTQAVGVIALTFLAVTIRSRRQPPAAP
jgi:hypothetical protein